MAYGTKWYAPTAKIHYYSLTGVDLGTIPMGLIMKELTQAQVAFSFWSTAQSCIKTNINDTPCYVPTASGIKKYTGSKDAGTYTDSYDKTTVEANTVTVDVYTVNSVKRNAPYYLNISDFDNSGLIDPNTGMLYPDPTPSGYVATGTELSVLSSGTTSGGISYYAFKKDGKTYAIESKYVDKSTRDEVHMPTVTQTTTNSEPVSESDVNDSTVLAGADSGTDPDAASGYQPDIDEMLADTDTSTEYPTTKNLVGVFGMPYQFLPTADARPDGGATITAYDQVGAEYADKIVDKIPLLFLAPGRPSFMTKFSKDDRTSIAEKLIQGAAGLVTGAADSLDNLLSDNEGKYYTFEYALEDYYKFVNPMCRISAIYLGIQNIKLNNGKTILDTNWKDYLQEGTSAFWNGNDSYMNIPFYIDADDSISESFGNSVSDSQLASTVDGISDLGREINFLTGYTSAMSDSAWVQEHADIASQVENLTDEVQKMLGSGGFISNLSSHLNTVATGGKIMFPQIWTGSSLSRSYSVKIKLISPDPTKLSIFLNVLVPLWHLLGLVAPQTAGANPNGYTSPFIVRAMYKGAFNVDMGIITSMSVEKGGSHAWTVDGIPSAIEVNLDIQDLYEAMAITKSDSSVFKYETMNNTALMDYIANCCGINVYKPEVGQKIYMWLANEAEDISNIPNNLWSRLNEKIVTKLMNIYRGY